MAKLWQFSQGHPKPAFSKKVQRGDQGKFFKNRPKSSPRLKGLKALWRKWHYPVISMYLKCKDWTRFWRKKRLRMAKLWQFLQGHPKPAFSEKVQRGDQGKFFKNRPKSSPRLKGPKALWRKWNCPLISIHLKCKDWKRFLGKNTSPKVPEWPGYGNFRKVTQNPHFVKKCKGGTKENFSKIAQKVALVWKAQKHSSRNGIIL